VERETALMAQVVNLLADGSNTPYWVWHPTGRFELHGPWAQHAGIEGHHLTHDEFFETVMSRPSVEQAFREAQEQLLPVSRIVTRDLGDGEILTTLSTFIPVRRANKDLLVMIGTSVDIDTQLKSQNKLDAAVAESKAQQAFVGALCATLSEHVGSTASAVERVRAVPSPPAAADLAIIAAGTRRVRQLVEDAAELYAAHAREPASPSEVPLAAVFDIAVREARRTAPQFEIDINPSLPPDRPVAGDPDAVRRIFEILIHNAATLGSLEGASKATVRVHYIAGPMCRIDVITMGPKVPPLDLSYLGEPYYKGSPRERVEPSGMRLAIARALANANGFKLTLANSTSDGEGLVATIEMPLAESHG
jgi:signal transduction histidine kinase